MKSQQGVTNNSNQLQTSSIMLHLLLLVVLLTIINFITSYHLTHLIPEANILTTNINFLPFQQRILNIPLINTIIASADPGNSGTPKAIPSYSTDSITYIIQNNAINNITIDDPNYIITTTAGNVLLIYQLSFAAIHEPATSVQTLLHNNGFTYIGKTNNASTSVASICEVFTINQLQQKNLEETVAKHNLSIAAIHNHYPLYTTPLVTLYVLTACIVTNTQSAIETNVVFCLICINF